MPRPKPTVAVGDVPRQQRGWEQHSDLQTCIDLILDSPRATHDLMNQFVVRVALGLILEDVRYQQAVSSLVTAYRMIGRITDGDFRLPKVRE